MERNDNNNNNKIENKDVGYKANRHRGKKRQLGRQNR